MPFHNLLAIFIHWRKIFASLSLSELGREVAVKICVKILFCIIASKIQQDIFWQGARVPFSNSLVLGMFRFIIFFTLHYCCVNPHLQNLPLQSWRICIHPNFSTFVRVPKQMPLVLLMKNQCGYCAFLHNVLDISRIPVRCDAVASKPAAVNNATQNDFFVQQICQQLATTRRSAVSGSVDTRKRISITFISSSPLSSCFTAINYDALSAFFNPVFRHTKRAIEIKLMGCRFSVKFKLWYHA